MIIELNIQDGNNCDSFLKYENFREAYNALINQIIEDKLYETRNVTVLRFKENDEILKVVQFAPSYSWERLLRQVEELPKLCETVLGNLNAALVFHEAFFKKAKTYKSPFMCSALSWAVASEIITFEGSELTKTYIDLALNQLAEIRGWVFVSKEISDVIFHGEEEAMYIKEGCEEFNKEDLALNLLLLDDEWMEGISEEKQIKTWWKALIRRLEKNIQPANQIAMGIRP